MDFCHLTWARRQPGAEWNPVTIEGGGMLSKRSHLAAWTGPNVVLVHASAYHGLSRVLPNCMASGGATGAVSWLMPGKMADISSL